MKLGLLVGGAVGYVLGAKAGHERYDRIVASARRVRGSQTVQSVAGVAEAKVEQASTRIRRALLDRHRS